MSYSNQKRKPWYLTHKINARNISNLVQVVSDSVHLLMWGRSFWKVGHWKVYIKKA